MSSKWSITMYISILNIQRLHKIFIVNMSAIFYWEMTYMSLYCNINFLFPKTWIRLFKGTRFVCNLSSKPFECLKVGRVNLARGKDEWRKLRASYPRLGLWKKNHIGFYIKDHQAKRVNSFVQATSGLESKYAAIASLVFQLWHASPEMSKYRLLGRLKITHVTWPPSCKRREKKIAENCNM